MTLLPFACYLVIILIQPANGFGRKFGQFKFLDTSEVIQSMLKPVLQRGTNSGGAAQLELRRKDLKQRLLEECQKNDRDQIEGIIMELQQVSPTPDAATNPLLQRKWSLEWTTEKEINFFIDWKLSGDVYQTIQGSMLANMIPFRNGGYLGVKGELSTDAEISLRTNFVFTEATLDLGRWGSFQIPPVGKGWFDTLYLDEELRVDKNSRNDILICTPMIDATK